MIMRNIVHHSNLSLLVESIKDRIRSAPERSMVTPTSVRPHDVDPGVYGHHASYVEDGERHWWFASAEGFAKFVDLLK